jgi:hypothetical protein
LAPSTFRLTSINFFQLILCGHSPYVTSSLTRECVCLLHCCWSSPAQLFLGPASPGLMTLYDSQGCCGGIRTRLHTEMTQTIFFVLFITPQHGPHRKHSSCIFACIRFCGNVFTQLFHTNGCTRRVSFRDYSSIVACGHYLATAVSLAIRFLLWVNMPQHRQRSRLIFQRCSVRKPAGTLTILFSRFFSALPAKFGNIISIGPQLLPYKSSPIHHSSLIMSFYTAETQSEIRTLSSDKKKRHKNCNWILPCGLRHGMSSPCRTLRSPLRISPEVWNIHLSEFILCLCCPV